MDLLEFKQSLRETNESLNLALKCAVIILERAKEFPPIQRTCALDMVKEFISIQRKNRVSEFQSILHEILQENEDWRAIR
jgi:hypothetical protein